MKGLIYTLLTAVCLMYAATAAAQGRGAQNATARVTQAARAMRTMQADFVQTKHLKMLGDRMVARGRMHCQQPDRLRWEYTSPYTYTLVMNGDRVMTGKGASRKVADMKGNRAFREVGRVMMNSLVGRSLTDSKDFRVSMADTPAEYVATLTPQRKEMKALYTRIVLHFSRRTAIVSKVVLHEANGDRTDIELHNVVTNKPLGEALFKIPQ